MPVAQGKILVILSSENQLKLADGKFIPTGFFLNELGVPAQRLVEAGYELVLANPTGNALTMDNSSDDVIYFAKDKAFHEQIKTFVFRLPDVQSPKTFRAILQGGLDTYAGLFVPGGHAPMGDLTQNLELGQILRHFHKESKPTAMICHGPAAALSAQVDPSAFLCDLMGSRETKAQDWIYRGYKMTAFSNVEERLAELKFSANLRFHLETALKRAGAEMHTAAIPWQSKVVQDRELLTGQNPFSDQQFTGDFLAMLAARRQTVTV